MKIIVADRISEHGVKLLADPGWQVVQPAAAALASELAEADALVVRSATQVTDELLSHAHRLRVIGRAGVGVDNIDLEAATQRGILVMNTPGGNAPSVAEHALALMLSMARSIPQLNASMHAGKWEKSGAAGAELRGKTLGLIGLGRVGAEVARRARALEMRVLAYDPYVSTERAAEWGAELVPLAELLAQADYVSLHTSLSSATERMINAETLRQMKPGARLVNAARGELVDEAALAEALRSKHLAGAALDVFAEEPPRNSPLLQMSNVIATPHVGGSTAEAQEEVGVQIAQQVREYLQDGTLRNSVNLPPIPPELYRRLRPYLDLAERMASLVAQAAPFPARRLRIACAGEPAELGTRVLRSAALAGVLNAPLEGNLLVMTNRDVPGVIGQVGTLLGSQGLNIASFALGRREAALGAEALAVVQLDGEVSEGILPLLRSIPNVMEARIVRLPVAASALSSSAG